MSTPFAPTLPATGTPYDGPPGTASPYDGLPVVVGAGLAGLVTALELGRPCLLVTGGALGVDCASDWAQGGLAAAVGPDDDIELHVADTLAAGAGLCEEDAVRRIVGSAPAVVDYLVGLGARFDREADGSLRLGLEGAHCRHRIVHAHGDGSGREITRAVATAVRASDHVRVLQHTVARRLHVDAGGIAGVDLLDVASGTVRRVATSHVVLATGGVGGLFAHTTNPRGSWGSGLALGLRAGAVARDLEMVQFHPTALDVGLDPMPLVSEAVRGEGVHLVDDLGRRVVADDLAARDVVSRAVWARLEAGGRVYLDTPAGLGTDFARRFPLIAQACAAAGLDPAVDRLPVRPAAHYHMGGLVTDGRGRTSVPGVWAVGEVASTGLHGANRLASNSLLEAVVMGRLAARDLRAPTARWDVPLAPSAAEPTIPTAAHQPTSPRPAADASASGAAGRPGADVRATLDQACGVLRDEPRLREALRAFRPGCEGDDARLIALLIAWSALQRTESRGGHTRTDHPRTAAPRHTDVTLAAALADLDGHGRTARSA